MAGALYRPGGFHLRDGSPANHFRTSAHVGEGIPFAKAVLRLLAEVDAELGRPDPLDFVDLGAGGGELAAAVLRSAARQGLAARLRVHGVDLRPRPAGLPPEIRWSRKAPSGTRGLLVANEYLDDVPCEVAVGTPAGPRLLTVTPSGVEVVGPAPRDSDAAWLQRWWPVREGSRAEVGIYRDMAWAAAVAGLATGVAVAVDYSHTREDRRRGDVAAGTLSAFRDGRRCPPVPDGSCNITCHVALDSCADAGLAAGATSTLLSTQRQVLRALLGAAPAAPTDARALQVAADVAELSDPEGLGSFGWLVQTKGCELPSTLG